MKVLSVDMDRKRISLSRKALLDRPAMPERDAGRGGKGGDRNVVLARADDPAMRKLRAKFGGSHGQLKGGLS